MAGSTDEKRFEQIDCPGSVTAWVGRLREGDEEAARHLWERFFQRMKSLARQRLGQGARGGAFDEEDVALSAFNGFAQSIDGGRYPDLENRDDLWRLLAGITVKKTAARRRDANRLKRGGGQVAESIHDGVEIVSAEPDPAMAATISEECSRLLGKLEDPKLEMVALWRLEGFSNEEIAQKLNLSRWTIQRMLNLIREIWRGASDTDRHQAPTPEL